MLKLNIILRSSVCATNKYKEMYSNVLLPDEFSYGERMSKVTSNIIRLKRFTDVDLS